MPLEDTSLITRGEVGSMKHTGNYHHICHHLLCTSFTGQSSQILRNSPVFDIISKDRWPSRLYTCQLIGRDVPFNIKDEVFHQHLFNANPEIGRLCTPVMESSPQEKGWRLDEMAFQYLTSRNHNLFWWRCIKGQKGKDQRFDSNWC